MGCHCYCQIVCDLVLGNVHQPASGLTEPSAFPNARSRGIAMYQRPTLSYVYLKMSRSLCHREVVHETVHLVGRRARHENVLPDRCSTRNHP
jgi:hypothetical protein